MAGVARSAWWAEAWVQAMNRLAARRAEGMEPNSVKVSHREPSLEEAMADELDRELAKG